MQAVIADLAERAGEAVAGDEVRSLLTVLADLAGVFRRQVPDGVAARWLGWLPSALSDDPRGPRPSDAVTLCSFHRAKGLEWDEVWVAGLERGLVPIGRATSAAAEAEERRLLYVALTRASASIHCSWARQRAFGTGSAPREASPWLELIRAAAGDPMPPGPGAAPDPADWRRRLHAQRQQLGDRGVSYPATIRLPPGWPEPDAELVSALRAWRASAARAAGIPAYVVLHDATLAALASRRPRTTEELLAVPGLGPVKAGRYGPTLLSLFSDRVAAG
jgi:DNA helicase-2/ATP-dependent DNA helicase PcrA